MTSPEQSGLPTFAKVALAVVIALVATVALGWLVVVLVVQAATAPRDGDAAARAGVERAAQELTDELGYWTESTDAETLAAERFTSPGDEGATVRPVAWSGTTNEGEGATVDVRITLRVEAESSPGLFQPSQTAGAAERCFRFAVQVTHDVTHREIDCPDSSALIPVPTPTPHPELAADAEARLTAVLTATEASTLASDVTAAFPEPDVTVDTEIVDEELVAAVGVPQARDCIVLVRRADGAIERIAFDRIQLEPGELGCSTRLYTSPAL